MRCRRNSPMASRTWRASTTSRPIARRTRWLRIGIETTSRSSCFLPQECAYTTVGNWMEWVVGQLMPVLGVGDLIEDGHRILGDGMDLQPSGAWLRVLQYVFDRVPDGQVGVHRPVGVLLGDREFEVGRPFILDEPSQACG